MRQLLFSVGYWAYLVLSLIVFWWVVLVPWLLITPFDRRRLFAHWYATTWANHLHAVSPLWTVVVQGVSKMRKDTAYVITANHESAADILVLFVVRRQFRWVAKRELFWIPFLGWMMLMAGYIGIKRGDRKSREDMLTACRRQLAMGNSVAMFPEGTRSNTGEMRPFKRGAFVLACENNVPVVPVVIHGTGGALPRASLIFNIPQRIYPVVCVLDPVLPSEFGQDPKALCDAVRARMELKLAELRAMPLTSPPTP